MVTYLHEAVQEMWRANLDRYEPDDLYDDSVTLGMGSARNLNNRVRIEVPRDEALTRAGVHIQLERNAVVVRTSAGNLRLVKAPLRSRRSPNFGTDFRWNDTEGRLLAAQRNAAMYSPSPLSGRGDTLFDLPEETDASKAIERCRDIFVVWAGELESGLTAGWLGLPTVGALPFIAVTQIWRDEPLQSSGAEPVPVDPSSYATFGNRPAPTPIVTLKPRSKEEKTP